MTLLALIFALAGFAALALGMHRHYRQVFQLTLRSGLQILLRLLGAVLLTASFVASVAQDGWAIGAVLWFGCLTLAALIVAAALSCWPRQVGRRA